jgi:hypothetical protein
MEETKDDYVSCLFYPTLNSFLLVETCILKSRDKTILRDLSIFVNVVFFEIFEKKESYFQQ